MKTVQTLLCSAAIALGAMATSCNGQSSLHVTPQNNIDSISYSYGVNLGEKGLTMYLQQVGVLSDTLQLQMEYNALINSESDSTKRLLLSKELKTKIDSTNQANKKNLSKFIKGLQEGFASPSEEGAFQTGVNVGKQIAHQMAPQLEEQAIGAKDTLNRKMILAGLINMLQGSKLAISNTDSSFNAGLEKIQEQTRAKREEQLKAQYKEQIAEEEAFLAQNKTQEGVVTLPNGLQYIVVKEGTGAKPTETDRVKVHYEGKLLNGETFDSSIERGEAATFGVNQVIKGWTEILQLMPVGSKYKVWIPYNLAYGASGSGKIPPFATLAFDIELISIEK